MNTVNEYNKKEIDSFTPEFLKLSVEEQITILQNMLKILDNIDKTLDKAKNDKVD